jgi:putative transcriptional regulator
MPTRFRLQACMVAADPSLTQSELARRSGVSVVTINAIANNKTGRVDLSTLDALSKALGCQPGDLIERDSRARPDSKYVDKDDAPAKKLLEAAFRGKFKRTKASKRRPDEKKG